MHLCMDLCLFAPPPKEFPSLVMCINMLFLLQSRSRTRFASLVHADGVQICIYPPHNSSVTVAETGFPHTFLRFRLFA